jgi:hypothetical protein
VRSKRQPDGRWLLDRIHPGHVHFDLEGVGAPSRWNTLCALRVLEWWDGTATAGSVSPETDSRLIGGDQHQGHAQCLRRPSQLGG